MMILWPYEMRDRLLIHEITNGEEQPWNYTPTFVDGKRGKDSSSGRKGWRAEEP
jgi:hypothetical protein